MQSMERLQASLSVWEMTLDNGRKWRWILKELWGGCGGGGGRYVENQKIQEYLAIICNVINPVDSTTHRVGGSCESQFIKVDTIYKNHLILPSNKKQVYICAYLSADIQRTVRAGLTHSWSRDGPVQKQWHHQLHCVPQKQQNNEWSNISALISFRRVFLFWLAGLWGRVLIGGLDHHGYTE